MVVIGAESPIQIRLLFGPLICMAHSRTVVLDNGASTLKVGFAGEDGSPR
jgi:hypothetical protein